MSVQSQYAALIHQQQNGISRDQPILFDAVAQSYCTEYRITDSFGLGFFGTPSNYLVTRNLYVIKSALKIMFVIIGFWVRKHRQT